MDTARGPRRPVVLPFVAPVPTSAIVMLAGLPFRIVGPTTSPKPPKTELSVPCESGGYYHFTRVDPAELD